MYEPPFNISFSSSQFTEEEAFIGYQQDTPAALIFQATNHCQRKRSTTVDEMKKAVSIIATIL